MPLAIDGEGLFLEEIEKFLKGEERVSLTDGARKKLRNSRELLDGVLESSEEPIYGITTGFGKLVEQKIAPEDREKLQENLIKSHSAGLGEFLPAKFVDLAILIRASSLCKGHSGIRPEVTEALLDLLNSDATPLVPEKGSLGASGDLIPLAHVASVLIGRGKAQIDGEAVPGREALKREGLEPVKLKEKEGLALINGTPFMTALNSIAAIEITNLLKNADLVASLTAEVLDFDPAPFDERIQKAKPYETQSVVAENVRKLTKNKEGSRKTRQVQDAYSIRCVPQVHGAVRAALNHFKEILGTELNSVTDNPLVFDDPPSVLSGGNFHGEPLALGADYLKMALADLSNISERRINRLLNPQLNNELPPFLSPDPGLNSGYMMAHYSAVSLVSENRKLSTPSSADNIPVSADQEDHVSMGMNAALDLKKVLENLRDVLAVELLCACQASKFREEKLSEPLEICREEIRKEIPQIEEDAELRPLIKKGSQIISENRCLEALEGKTELG